MLYYFLLLIFTPLFIWLSCKKPIWALAIIVFALPSYLVRFKIGFVPMTLLETMILIVFIVWLIKVIRAKQKINFSKFKWLIMAWLIISGLAVLISPNKLAALGIWKAYFIEPILFFIVFINLIKNKKDLNLIFYALGASALIVSLIAIYQKFTGWLVPFNYWFRGEGPRVTSLFDYPNALGLYLGPVVGIFLGKILGIKNLSFKKIFNLIYYVSIVLLAVLAIIFARSEGAILGIIIALFIFGLVIKRFRIKTAFIILIIVILFFTIAPLKQALVNYTVQKISLADWSMRVRVSMWGGTWQMLKHNWFWGSGLAGYQTKMLPYHRANYLEIFLYPHNIFFNFWAELGILGLLNFLGLVLLSLKRIFLRLKTADLKQRAYLWGCLLAILIILIHGLVDVPYFKNDLAVLWWLIFGVISVI